MPAKDHRLDRLKLTTEARPHRGGMLPARYDWGCKCRKFSVKDSTEAKAKRAFEEHVSLSVAAEKQAEEERRRKRPGRWGQ